MKSVYLGVTFMLSWKSLQSVDHMIKPFQLLIQGNISFMKYTVILSCVLH